jgi:hypothetical protein
MKCVKASAFAVIASVLLLLAGASLSRAVPDQNPGTVRYSWLLRWPEKGREHVFVRKFRDRGGLLRRVRVFIAGRPVLHAPYITEVGCVEERRTALAQKTWLWDGHNVFVAVLMIPGRCHVAGTLVRVQVALTTKGT